MTLDEALEVHGGHGPADRIAVVDLPRVRARLGYAGGDPSGEKRMARRRRGHRGQTEASRRRTRGTSEG